MKRIALVLVGTLALALGCFRFARADAAPPDPPPGSSITGEYPTNVQMVSEDVTITLLDDTTAEVVATFDLRNQGTAAEAFDVRFPLGSPDVVLFHMNPISDFNVWVDGKVVEYHTEDEPDYAYEDFVIPWGHWYVEFPPGQTVRIGVAYFIERASPRQGGETFGEYVYILHTGAGWSGPIGEGTIRFRLPYEANEYNLVLENYGKLNPDWYTISGTDVVWQFTNLEPTEADDISVVAMLPALWRAISNAREYLNAHPDSLDGQLSLAHALRDALPFERHGILVDSGSSFEMAREAASVYEAAVALAPNSAVVASDYALYLVGVCQYAPEELGLCNKLLPALDRAITLDPTNQQLIDLQLWARESPGVFGITNAPTQAITVQPTSTYPPGYTPASPVADVSRTPNATRAAEEVAEVATATQTDSPSALPEGTDQPANSGGGCFGVGALVLIPLGVVVLRRHRSG